MAEGDKLLAAAAAAAAALAAARSTPEPLGQEALQRLFPGCSYLALGVSRLQPAIDCNAASTKPLLLLGGTTLLESAKGKAPPPAAAAVHLLPSSLSGSAILAGRPLTCRGTAAQAGGGGNDGTFTAAGWSDTAQAMQQCSADSFLCLPFQVAGMGRMQGQGADAVVNCSSSAVHGSACSRKAVVVASLLLGLAPSAAGQEQPPQQQQQGQQTGSQPWARHLRAVVQLAAALVRHAQCELVEAAEGLTVLQSAAPVAAPISGEGELAAGSAEEGSDLETVDEEDEEEVPAEDCCIAGVTAATPAVAGVPGPSSSQPRPAGPLQQAVGDGNRAARGQGADAEVDGALQGAAGLLPLQQPQQQPSGGSGQAPSVEAGAGGALPPRLPACVHALLALCRALLAPLLQLLASRRDLQLDCLLRFREAGRGAWQAPGALSPIGSGGNAESHAAAASEQQAWAQQAQQALLGPEPLERQFLRYHARLMADKVDAAGSLILLAILVLLSKEPSCAVQVGDPAFCAVAAVLALPLAALLPGAPHAWYVRRREQLLQLFFMLVLLYQQAVHNFIDSHSSRASQARYVNAGFAWLTVDGVLLQMRFCRQLPTLVACFLLNLRAIPEVCGRYHAHLDPRRCAASGFLRGVLCLLTPLAITYLLELRMRRNWLMRRQAEARSDAEVQRALRAQRQRERQGARTARAAGAGARSATW